MTAITFASTPQIRVLAACVLARVPLLIKGDPGQGKTARINAIAGEWGYYFESITGSNREATDFLGLPVEVDGEQRYTSLDWARRINAEARDRPATGSVLFLDEFNTQEDSMKAMLRVLEERYVGPDKLADNVAIVAAMNPANIATGGIDLPSPIANRVVHMDWHFDFDAWAEGFVTGFTNTQEPALDELVVVPTDADLARLRSSVVAFLRSHSTMQNDCPKTDPEKASGPWPSTRMWTKAVEAIAWLHPDDTAAIRLLLTGAVGREASVAFMSWMEQQDLYDPEEVLAKPSIVDWRGRPDRLYAMTLSVASLIKMRDDSALWTKGLHLFASGANAGRMDTAWIGARILINAQPTHRVGIPSTVRTAFKKPLEAVGLLAAA